MKPSAVAFSNMVNNYRHAIPVGKYAGQSYGFAYDNQGKNQLCLWTEKGSKEETLYLPNTKKVNVTDIFGRVQQLKVLNGKVIVTISYLPITITGFVQDDFTRLYAPRKVVK